MGAVCVIIPPIGRGDPPSFDKLPETIGAGRMTLWVEGVLIIPSISLEKDRERE
jgi:hypothetical protein